MSTIIGVVLGAVLSYGAVWLTQRGEDKRTTKTDRQHLRDLKAARLRELYVPVVAFADTMTRIASEKSYTRQGETSVERDKRHERALHEGLKHVEDVRHALMIEPSTVAVLEALNAAVDAYDVYLRSLQDNAVSRIGIDELNKQAEAIANTSAALGVCCLRQLEQLETPI
jgi:hypothetical protein